MASAYKTYEDHVNALLTSIEDAIVAEVQRRCPQVKVGSIADPYCIAAGLHTGIEIHVCEVMSDNIMSRLDNLYPEDAKDNPRTVTGSEAGRECRGDCSHSIAQEPQP